VLRYVHNWYTGNLANATFQIFITRRHNVTFVLQTQTSRETQCLLGLTEFCAKNLKIVRTKENSAQILRTFSSQFFHFKIISGTAV